LAGWGRGCRGADEMFDLVTEVLRGVMPRYNRIVAGLAIDMYARLTGSNVDETAKKAVLDYIEKKTEENCINGDPAV